MTVLLVFGLCVFYSFWRRLYGGGFFRTGLLSKRGFQCVLFLVPTFFLALNSCSGYDDKIRYGFSVWFAVWTYCQFWARGIGSVLDSGRDVNPLDSTISRYYERWYHVPCDLLLRNHKYGFAYDRMWMGLRYTCPMALLWFVSYLFPMLPQVDWRIVLIGLSVSPIYALSWTFYEREEWMFKRFDCLNYATNLAEFLSGFAFGFWVLCI